MKIRILFIAAYFGMGLLMGCTQQDKPVACKLDEMIFIPSVQNLPGPVAVKSSLYWFSCPIF